MYCFFRKRSAEYSGLSEIILTGKTPSAITLSQPKSRLKSHVYFFEPDFGNATHNTPSPAICSINNNICFSISDCTCAKSNTNENPSNCSALLTYFAKGIYLTSSSLISAGLATTFTISPCLYCSFLNNSDMHYTNVSEAYKSLISLSYF